jgi:hypothetical protein
MTRQQRRQIGAADVAATTNNKRIGRQTIHFVISSSHDDEKDNGTHRLLVARSDSDGLPALHLS